MSKTKIIIADDHRLIRDGIKTLLTKDAYEVIGEAENGLQVLDLMDDHPADVIMMDINMDEMDGIACTQEVKKLYNNVKIIALSMLAEQHYIKEMIKAGASGYIHKNCNQQEIINAIDQVLRGGNYYSPQITQVIMNSLSGNEIEQSTTLSEEAPLTSREKEILKLVLEEFSNQEIADKLDISKRTVEAHKRNLLEKTGSKNLAGLVRYGLEHGIIE